MPEITYETPSNHVRVITMNRPETLNSLSPDGSREMLERVRAFRDDPDAWVLIITGAGERSFSTGADLRARAQSVSGERQGPPPPPPQVPRESLHSYPSIEVFKPTIAAINGYALGGGLEIALWCDLRIAADHAEIGLPEPRRGSMSISGVTRLSHYLPYTLAMELILTARRYKAAELFRMGLINKVVPLPELMPTAIAWAEEIVTENAPMSNRMAKEFVYRSMHLPIREALQMQSLFSERLRQLAANDYAEGARAFAEKRKPQFQGR
jgi:enoyl-CoA hydratase/carnithine racemase